MEFLQKDTRRNGGWNPARIPQKILSLASGKVPHPSSPLFGRHLRERNGDRAGGGVPLLQEPECAAPCPRLRTRTRFRTPWTASAARPAPCATLHTEETLPPLEIRRPRISRPFRELFGRPAERASRQRCCRPRHVHAVGCVAERRAQGASRRGDGRSLGSARGSRQSGKGSVRGLGDAGPACRCLLLVAALTGWTLTLVP